MTSSSPVRPQLRADCEHCFALCCVASTFSVSADFAIDKRAGQPCPNLQPEFRCGIHDRLREQGFAGCTAYDCFGAGQAVSREQAGADWRVAPQRAAQMFALFAVTRQLHELLWYLNEARLLQAAQPMYAQLDAALAQIEALARQPAQQRIALDVEAQRVGVGELLLRVSALERARLARATRDYRRADLIGAKLRGADLRGADLRGALLLGADLRGADLRGADLLGADFRGARLGAADLRDSLFLIQSQLTAADGDRQTQLPPSLARPAHWAAIRLSTKPRGSRPPRGGAVG